MAGYPHSVIAEAAEWVGLLDSGEANDADRTAWKAWYAQNPAHKAVFDEMCDLNDRLDSSSPVERGALRSLLAQPAIRAERVARIGVIALVFAGLGWVAAGSDFVRDRFPDHETARGVQQTVALKSGSNVVLDSGSAIRVDESGGHDDVRLVEGRIFARVRHVHDRPFVVETRLGTATAMGTAYAVGLRGDEMLVSVAQSVVEVCPSGGKSDCMKLAPGDQARVAAGRVVMERHVAPASIGGWASGWIDAVDEDLATTLDEINRYRANPVQFDRASLKGLKVSGNFPVADTDAALAGIARSSGTRLLPSPDGTSVRLTR